LKLYSLLNNNRGGLGPKSLRSNKIYKGHIEIVKKASLPFEKAIKNVFKKPRNPQKIHHFSEKVFKNN
jgi:hypothetical protein